MERREAIKYTAFFMGAALSGSTVAAMLSGCEVDTSTDWKPSFFTDDECSFIEEIGETILPRTQTPGAKDALVGRYLDTIRPLRFTAEQNEAFKKDLNAFMDSAASDLGKPFVKAAAEKQLAWVQDIDKKAFETRKAQLDQGQSDKPFYLTLKELLLGAYFNSEAVARDYFAFDPIPGKYLPCIPYADVGRAWAL